jgi:hypothetical protein
MRALRHSRRTVPGTRRRGKQATDAGVLIALPARVLVRLGMAAGDGLRETLWDVVRRVLGNHTPQREGASTVPGSVQGESERPGQVLDAPSLQSALPCRWTAPHLGSIQGPPFALSTVTCDR